ncbi:TlpA disulfide reductase family protein [uncultured Muribaculum sp.]|uniref:TlpA family protein disulfide reductase n=1 Tax=uncultured Muribaculum sp. TaxID=1918613 RepID=UPI00259A06E2|nr:TlpA disulfide reductase family protein [uncultured Muribaculum sp.]
MKFQLILLSIALTACGSQEMKTTTVTIKSNQPKVYFQPENSLGYNQIETADTTLTLDIDIPAYYSIMGGNAQKTVYVAPGSTTNIEVNDSGITITGDLSAENEFANANRYLCRTPDSIEIYSPKWVDYQTAEVARLSQMLEESGLDRDFIDTHKLYYLQTFLNQRLNGPRLDNLFGSSKSSLSENYYDFLDSLRFNNPKLLSQPKWFEIVNGALSQMESHAFIPVDNENYMSIYADRIDDGNLKSKYLIRLLDLVLKSGYTNDFTNQVEKIRPMIIPADTAALSALVDSCAKLRELETPVARGKQIPEFTANTLSGKEYSISDFKGKLTVIDFWYTGCIPCKAEVPYFEKLAKELDGKDVQFISVSLDTGDELIAEWKKVMKAKPADSRVLGLNLPDGFNSDLLPKLQINKVPRIMLIDKEGKIIDSYAKRPSDPKLKQQIEALL